MYPYLLQSVAAERASDLRKEAATGARARRARGTRARGTRARTGPGIGASRAGARLVRRAAHS
jgi:hypothetical protein